MKKPVYRVDPIGTWMLQLIFETLLKEHTTTERDDCKNLLSIFFGVTVPAIKQEGGAA